MLVGEMENLRVEVNVMARRAEDIFGRAAGAIRSRDEAVVRDIRSADRDIDECEIRVDALCFAILSSVEPSTPDFRYVYSTLRTVMDLERIGDQSKTISKWSVQLRLPGRINELEELADRVRQALGLAIDALVAGDVSRAEQVLALEFQVDALEDRIIEDSTDIGEAFVAKALERVADLATNIAENVIYYVGDRDIRHGRFEDPG